MPHPPCGPNIPTDEMNTIPPRRMNRSGFDRAILQTRDRTGRGRVRNAWKLRSNDGGFSA